MFENAHFVCVCVCGVSSQLTAMRESPVLFIVYIFFLPSYISFVAFIVENGVHALITFPIPFYVVNGVLFMKLCVSVFVCAGY